MRPPRLELYEAFGSDVEKLVRSELGRMGRYDVLGDTDEVTGLTIDACLLLFRVARRRIPSGQPPWVYARRAITSHVGRSIGHRTVEYLPEARAHWGGPGRRHSSDRPARRDRRPRAGGAAARRRSQTCRPRSRLRGGVNAPRPAGFGRPAPAHTAASECNVTPGNARQIVSRTRRKVRQLAATDGSFSDLGQVVWLAA